MNIPDINAINDADEARNLAIDWSNWEPESLSYNELTEWNVLFTALADKFPELKDEFSENGII